MPLREDDALVLALLLVFLLLLLLYIIIGGGISCVKDTVMFPERDDRTRKAT